MRSFLYVFLAIACLACKGADEEKECDVPDVHLIVSLLDVQEEPIDEADVRLNDEPCSEQGEGLYSCEVVQFGEQHVYAAKLPNYRPAAQFVQVEEPEPGCDPIEEQIELRLQSYIGGTR